MTHPSRLNIGAYLSPRCTAGMVLPTITAGAGQDNTEQTPTGIDRTGFDSATIAIVSKAVLTAAETLTLSATLQESSDDSTYTDVAAEFQPGAASGGGTIGSVISASGTNVNQYDVNLRGLKQYIRLQFTADLSKANTDTATVAAVIILGGSAELPQT